MKILVPLAVLALSSALRAQDPCGVWSPVPIPDPPGATQTVVEDMKALGPDLAWAVGRQTAPIVGGVATKTVAWRWDGTSWTIVPTPSPSPFPEATWCELEAVEILSANDVWAAGTQRIVGPDGFLGNQVLVLHWNGAQWSIVPSPMTNGGSGNFVDDIEAISANDIWFVGDWLTFPPNSAARKEALAMHWNGSSFAILPAPFFDNAPIGGHGLTKVAAIASEDVWSVGGGHDGDYVGFSYVIHWNGSQWQYVPGPTAGVMQRWYDVVALASDDVWISGEYDDASGTPHGLAARWNGSSWTRLPDPPTGAGGLHVFAPDRAYVSGTGISRWNGTGWDVVETFPTVGFPSALALEPIADCSLWAVGRRISGDVMSAFAARLVPDGSSVFCTGMPNSAGAGASIGHTGSSSISAANLVLTVSGVPPRKFGRFFYGDQRIPPIVFGNGVRCVGGPLKRLPVVAASASGAAAQAFPYAGSNVTAGSARSFQFWYRDPPAGGALYNASNALEIVFAP